MAIDFIALAFAVYYVSQALVHEEVAQPFRDWLASYTLPKGPLLGWFRRMLLCQVCVSFWMAVTFRLIQELVPFGDVVINAIGSAGVVMVWLQYRPSVRKPE